MRCLDQAGRFSLSLGIHPGRLDELFGGIIDRTAFPASRLVDIHNFGINRFPWFRRERHFIFHGPLVIRKLKLGVVHAIKLP